MSRTYDDYIKAAKGEREAVLECYEDRRGMMVTSGVVTIQKDDSNLIGVSIGGGAPLCPCLYIVQVFDNTPCARDGTLESGDEIVGVKGQSVKGKSKVEVAKMIQSSQGEVTIKYNKLHADPKKGKNLDLILKKLKHHMVENMSSSTADALGLSRAILCNDSLVKKLEELERTELMYKGLVDHTKRVLRGYFDLLMVCKEMGDIFCNIGVREPQKTACEAFCMFGEYHRQMEKYGIKMLKETKPILHDLGTYLNKAIPDTKLTIKKYADVKFEYLSYCLKVKELDDEDVSYAALGEPLYRVETGNYEYRLVLRCRADARHRFAKLRSDVLVKLELLDNKHVQDIVFQLRRLMSGMTSFHKECQALMKDAKLFPIEVDLTRTAFQYKSTNPVVQDDEDENENDDEVLAIEHAAEATSASVAAAAGDSDFGDFSASLPPPPASNVDLLGLDTTSSEAAPQLVEGDLVGGELVPLPMQAQAQPSVPMENRLQPMPLASSNRTGDEANELNDIDLLNLGENDAQAEEDQQQQQQQPLQQQQQQQQQNDTQKQVETTNLLGL